MSDEPENITLKMLRELRDENRELKARIAKLEKRLKEVDPDLILDPWESAAFWSEG